MTELLLASSEASNLLAARLQMAFTLGFHIILACFGVGMPVLMLVAEWMSLKGDASWRELARRWSKAFAVLFAIGAVSGTVLSFELGTLWPKFMGEFGAVIGLPFTLEAYAFFLEAVFAGIYLYGWDRLSPRLHWLCGLPIAISGMASAWFVVTANAWMNCPRGFTIEKTTAGYTSFELGQIDPLAAMLNPATGAQTTHMILAAYMVSGFCVAAFYAWLRIRGDQSVYVRRAMRLGLALGVIVTPFQIFSGDWAAKVVAETQPVKLAAMEAHFETKKAAPLMIGGIPDVETGRVSWALKIPGGLSFLAYGDASAEVKGLNDFDKQFWPPVSIVHFAFQIMVTIGTALLGLSLYTLGNWMFKRKTPTSRWFLICVLLAGPAAVIALESGWVVTEVGRQPWIVHQLMLTKSAVTNADGIWTLFYLTMAVYGVLLIGSILSLRYFASLPLQAKISNEHE